MRAFSFFSNRHTSGTIRGKQIAERMVMKSNPTEGYDDDICIFVKMEPFYPSPKRTYIDVIDGIDFIPWLKTHPELGVIAFTRPSQQKLMNVLERNDVVYIPQHHCNFERILRPDRKVKVVGCNGSKFVLGYDTEKAKEMFRKIGLEFRFLIYPSSRRGVTSWYKGIDLHICFRAKMKYYNFKDSLKIVNAGSYGVPTVAFPEPNNELEFKDCYVPVITFEEFVEQCNNLKNDPDFYNRIATKVLAKTEDYHIDNILKHYYDLGKINE